MNTLQTLKEIGHKVPMINFVGTGDIFNLNNLSDVQYPLFWISLATNSGANGETITPRFRIYYVDRLLDDKSNQLDVEMDAMYKLNEYIYALGYQLPIQTPVQIVHFQQRFNDMCAGGYFEMNIEEEMCGIELKPFEFPSIPLPKLYFSEQFSGDGSSANPITLKDGIIPTDILELSDDTNIIPPPLFFDDTYFSGAGTQVDPKSLRIENLPSGGGAQKRFVEIKIGEGEEVRQIDITKWSDGSDLDLDNGKFYKIEYFVNGGHWTSIHFGDFTGDFHTRNTVLAGFTRFTLQQNDYYSGTMTLKISDNVIIGTNTNANRTTTPTSLTEQYSFTSLTNISTYLPFGKVTLRVNGGGRFEQGTVIRLEEI